MDTSKIHDKDKSLSYIKSLNDTNYDSRWLKGAAQERYLNYEIKRANESIYSAKKSILKFYQVDFGLEANGENSQNNFVIIGENINKNMEYREDSLEEIDTSNEEIEENNSQILEENEKMQEENENIDFSQLDEEFQNTNLSEQIDSLKEEEVVES